MYVWTQFRRKKLTHCKKKMAVYVTLFCWCFILVKCARFALAGLLWYEVALVHRSNVYLQAWTHTHLCLAYLLVGGGEEGRREGRLHVNWLTQSDGTEAPTQDGERKKCSMTTLTWLCLSLGFQFLVLSVWVGMTSRTSTTWAEAQSKDCFFQLLRFSDEKATMCFCCRFHTQDFVSFFFFRLVLEFHQVLQYCTVPGLHLGWGALYDMTLLSTTSPSMTRWPCSGRTMSRGDCFQGVWLAEGADFHWYAGLPMVTPLKGLI